MRRRGWMLPGALCLLTCMLVTAGAAATETVSLHANFTPDRLGASTNLSATVLFGSTLPGPVPPVTAVTTYGPAGMSLDVRGLGVCTVSASRLEALGPSACPADSRLGFGRAEGLLELAGELVPGPLTLEFFLAPRQQGQLSLLIYVDAVTPAAEEFAMVAREVHGPHPYGLGIGFAVPIVPSLPGAALGWVEHVLVTLGSAHAAYYRTLHGKRRLFHVRGLTVPRSCPAGGFPVESQMSFADGNSTIAKTTIPCPPR